MPLSAHKTLASAQPGPEGDFTVGRPFAFRFGPVGDQRFAVQRLMQSLRVLVIDVFRAQVIKVLLAKYRESVQAFLLD